jgi:hypothetical protein
VNAAPVGAARPAHPLPASGGPAGVRPGRQRGRQRHGYWRGAIGGNLARKLSEAGHEVQVADARGPEAAVRDRDVIILSIDRVPECVRRLATDVIVAGHR